MDNFTRKKTKTLVSLTAFGRKSLAILLTLGIILTSVYAVPALATSTSPVVSLSFDGAVADSANQGAITTVYDSTSKTYPPNYTGKDYGPTNDNTSSFGGSGADAFWAWHSSSEYGGGLSIDIPTTAISSKTYTLGLRFSLDQVNGYKKVIDFKNRTADNGFYIYDGQVNFFTTTSQGNQGTFNKETAYTFLIVRDESAKTFKVFLDSDPIHPIFSLSNIDDNVAVPDEITNGSNTYYRFGFFYDDLAYLDGASQSGKVYSIKVWDEALSDAQINKQLNVSVPSAPMVSAIYTGASAISGTAEADSTVTITFPDNTSNSVVAGFDGIWSIILTAEQKATLINGSVVSVVADNDKGTSAVTLKNVSVVYAISTVAGTGATSINMPTGVATDNSGNIYIAEYKTNIAQKVDANGTVSALAGTGVGGFSGDNALATEAKLYWPYGLTTDVNGNVYIADHNNNRIRKINSNGIITTIAGTGTEGYNGDNILATSAQLFTPTDVKLDSSGNIYIADMGNNRVRKIDSNGIITTVAGVGTEGYSGDGGLSTAAQLRSPYGIALDNNGNGYIADLYNHCIRKVSSNGIITTIAGTGTAGYSGDGGPATSAKLYIPSDVVCDGNGNIYFSDTGNHRIRKIDSTGNISTIAGTGTASYSGDGGLATTASLNYPIGLSIDSNGNLYIADHGNGCIRKLSPVTEPTVSEVKANSTDKLLMKDSILTGSYTYNTTDGMIENGSSYVWQRYDSAIGGTGTVVGTDLSYKLSKDDIGKYISFTVVPSNAVMSGVAVESNRIGAIIAPSITAIPKPLENYVSLSWDSVDKSQTYHYMVTKRDADIVDSIAQTIPLKPTAHVLNVYPGGGTLIDGVTDINGNTVDTSANVKVWMEENGADGYGKGLISVDCVKIGDFNANPDSYLKNDSGKYQYDVVFIGAWDSNNNRDISDTAETALDAFINAGGGYLSGHDSGYTAYTNLPKLLNKFANMVCNGSIGSLGNTTVNVVKKGLLTNYPWTLSGKTLTVPYSHTTTQFAMGDIWMKYPPIASEISSFGGKSGTNNFYLTTWNNVAMIQTGHSQGAATVDEQKVLANTLLYLSQVSTDTSFDDHSSQDVLAPSAVSDITIDSIVKGNTTIKFNSSIDSGNNYEYQLKAIGDTDNQTYTSDIVTANITSGISGYAVVVDKLPNTDPGDVVNTTTNSFTINNLATGLWYAHVKAIDNAGNASNVITTQLNIVYPSITNINANSKDISLINGNILTASYTYNANDSGVESGSTYVWLRYDNLVGGIGTQVGTGLTYTLTANDIGKYLSFTVIPSNGTVSGPSVESERLGAIAPLIINTIKSGSSGSSVVKQSIIELPSYVKTHKKYISGYPNGTFGPGNNMTRAEFAQALFNLMATTNKDYTNNSNLLKFSDVSKGDWYTNAISYLISIDATQGYQDGTYKPMQPITRAEAIAVIARITNSSKANYNNEFSDTFESWAKDYISSAYAKGWINGYNDGTFQPDNDITRAEVVALINKVQKRKIIVADIPTSAQKFTDINETDWCYCDIIEASNGHSFTRFSETDSEKWVN